MHRSPHPPTRARRRLAVALVAAGALAAVLAPGGAAEAQAPAPGAELSPEVQAQIEALAAEKAGRSPAEAKVSSQLLRAGARQRPALRNAATPELRSSVEVVDGRTLVDIDATVTQNLLDAIEAAGGTVVSSVAAFDAIRAEVPLDAVVALAGRDDVDGIRPADRATTNSEGSGANEAEVTHAADQARISYEVDGSGSKVCVLSDGVDSLPQRVFSGDLPEGVDILSGQQGSGDEGTAMLELIHDIAPGAELGFATGFTGVAQFAANIVALEHAGCTVIVDDVTYFNESNFQDGPIARAVSQVRASGVPYFSSAGNSGNKADGTSGTWQGDFDNEGAAASGPLAGQGLLHGWGLSGTPYNTLTQGSTGGVDLLWADPLGGATNDYDLYILDSSGTEIVDGSNDVQNGDDDPYESVGEVFTGERVVVVRWSGANRYLAVYSNRGRLTTNTGGSARGHNASVDAISVGATPADGPYPGQHSAGDVSETFSSDGPVRQFFSPTGAALTPGNFSSSGGVSRNGVDITAADGVTTTTPGFETFFGTSAAAPNAAALAALALEVNPTMTPGRVEQALAAGAIDIEAPGVDPVTGAGIVMAPDLLDAAADAIPDGAVYVPITPCRILDTRIARGPLDNREIRDVQVRGTGNAFAAQGGKANGCAIPNGATAVEASVTAVDPADSGFFRAWPGDESMPNATFMNFDRGKDITNTGAITLGGVGSGELKIRNFGGRSQYVIDLQGYYLVPGDGSVYVSITPCRIVDTRIQGGSFANREIRDYDVRGSGSSFAAQGGKANGCGIPDEATGVEASVTSVSPADSGFFRAWPGDESMPNATFMNFARNQDITNTGALPLAAGGPDDLTVRNFGGRSQYVIDVQGYFVGIDDVPNDGSGSLYVPITPCRIVDTRNFWGALANREIRDYHVRGRGSLFARQQGGKDGGCFVPPDAMAAEASVTSVSPTDSGFFRAWPGDESMPNATFMNFARNQDITNTGSITLADSGADDLTVRNFGGRSQYVIDLQGYWRQLPILS